MIDKDKLTIDYFEEKFEEQPPDYVVRVSSCGDVTSTCKSITPSRLWYGVDKKGSCAWLTLCPYQLNLVVLTIEAAKVEDTWFWKVSYWSNQWNEH